MGSFVMGPFVMEPFVMGPLVMGPHVDVSFQPFLTHLPRGPVLSIMGH
jgi:hypothetical protein